VASSPSKPRPPVGGWATTAALAGLAGARLAGIERRPSVAGLNAATPLAYLPAHVVAARALARGQRRLAAAAAAVGALHLAWVLPEVLPRRRPSGPEGPALRLVSANLQFSTRDWSGLGRELAGLAPDLLLVQELSPAAEVCLRAAGAFEGLDFSHTDPRPGSFGSGIWSRHPLEAAETWDVAGGPMTRATVKLGVNGGAGHLRVYNVHTRSPLLGGLPRWEAQLRLLATEVAAERARWPVPTVVAGDFNATRHNRPFRRLLAAGLIDAHEARGRGWVPTWRPRPHLPALLRLDHILVSGDVAVDDAWVGSGFRRSDHRPVATDLTLLGPGEPVAS